MDSRETPDADLTALLLVLTSLGARSGRVAHPLPYDNGPRPITARAPVPMVTAMATGCATAMTAA